MSGMERFSTSTRRELLRQWGLGVKDPLTLYSILDLQKTVHKPEASDLLSLLVPLTQDFVQKEADVHWHSFFSLACQWNNEALINDYAIQQIKETFIKEINSKFSSLPSSSPELDITIALEWRILFETIEKSIIRPPAKKKNTALAAFQKSHPSQASPKTEQELSVLSIQNNIRFMTGDQLLSPFKKEGFDVDPFYQPSLCFSDRLKQLELSFEEYEEDDDTEDYKDVCASSSEESKSV